MKFAWALLLLPTLAWAAEPKPTVSAYARRDETKIRITTEDKTTTLHITCPAGIDRATIKRETDRWPQQVVVRLHLSGLESFRLNLAKVAVEWFVSSSDDHATTTVLHQNNQEIQLDKSSPYFSPLKIVGGNGKIPLKDGYFEVLLPAKCFADNPAEIQLAWIDFYRG